MLIRYLVGQKVISKSLQGGTRSAYSYLWRQQSPYSRITFCLGPITHHHQNFSSQRYSTSSSPTFSPYFVQNEAFTRPLPTGTTTDRVSATDKLFHNKQPKYKAVIFDKDGTLVCFHTLWTPWAKALNQRLCQATGLDLSQPIYNLLGVCSHTLKARPGLLAEGTKAQIKQALIHLLLTQGGGGFTEAKAQEIVEANFEDGGVASECLRQLHNLSRLLSTLQQHGVKVAVCTSDSRPATVSALRQLGILHLVDKVVCADDADTLPKPNPQSALRICDELGVSPNDVVMVGDTCTDMAYAKNAQLGGCIGVLSGVGQETALRASGAQQVINSVADILPVLLPDRVISLGHASTTVNRIQQHQWKLVILDKDGSLADVHFRWSRWALKVGQRLEHVISATGGDGRRAASQFYTLMGLCENSTRIQGGLLAHGTVLHMKESLQHLLLLLGVHMDAVDDVMGKVWIDPAEFPDQLLEGALEALQNMKQQGLLVAINTSDTRECTERFLDNQNLRNLVDCVVTSSETQRCPKPLPQSNLMICNQLGVNPRDAILFGDSCADMLSARAAHLGAAVALLSGTSTAEYVLPHADILIPNLSYASLLLTRNSANSSTTELLSPSKASKKEYSSATIDLLKEPVTLQNSFRSQVRHYSTSSSNKAAGAPSPPVLQFPQAAGTGPTTREKSEEYDYIVVGAGSAGCVLANRLSAADSNHSNSSAVAASVCLLEAGPEDNTWTIDMPAALMYNLCHDKYNWHYHTIPEPHMNNREMYWPRGRVWGGSSALNAMVYVRGHPDDYDLWERMGAKGWSYFDCLPYFRRSQCHELGEDAYRGGHGPLHVSRGKTNHPLHQAWLQAGQEAGYPFSTDMNGYEQEGVAYMDMTVHKGVRWSTSKAFLRPALQRNNLTVHSKTLVHRVLFDGKRAIGVEVSDFDRRKVSKTSKHQVRRILARKEVILSGGSINSPQLLLLSGIGDADHLREVGIDNIIQHLPGVGRNLQEHLEVYVQQKCKQPITLYKAQWKYPHHMIMIGLEYFARHTGWGATSHMETGGFVRTSSEVPHPNIQYHFLPSTVVNHGREMGICHAYQVHAGPMRSESRGRVWLRSADPREHPNIMANYMSTENDRRELRDGIRLAREIFAQPAFDPYRGEEFSPGVDCQSDSQLDAFIRAKGDSAYHPSCTCRMGSPNDADTVVDPECRVLGLEGLRVVDASIMPSIVSGNLNAPVIMMAEKASDMILGHPPLPKEEVPVWKPRHPERQRDGNPVRNVDRVTK